ncbi:RagB/SusD family nutrient uptake outer membrane protein [Niabella sp. CC-SYL272]|uniref:RagB/SusD family nutrient uptake outer membrane protein n=1 Tax=Niabella agricola TaxID=2891571 RepID=UPI001F468AB8|nr:RagB/SusD family nutrient uptake outer membrane protein [Niabella agricola]MCF3109698.1 RagB/SusD family nutrient uptake outer membrane protein [Niabella agricola]
MKNKLSLYIYSTLCITAASTSCKKFLDTDSPSNFTQEYIYANSNEAVKGVYSIYALFNQDAFTSRLSDSFIPNTDVEVGGVGSAPDNSRRDIWSMEATDANGDIRTVWENAYNAINRANIAVEGIEQSPRATQADMKQLLGEAKALRALWYYWLINYWGDVPFKLKPTRGGDTLYLSRTDRGVILSTLIQDLISVEPGMKPAADVEYGVERVNREFVQGLIARLALCRGGYWLYPDMIMRRKEDYKDYYQIARDYAHKAIYDWGRTLNPSFAAVFDNQSKWIVDSKTDVLYEVAFQPGFGDVGWNIGMAVDAGDHNYGSGSTYKPLAPSYAYSFDTLDARLAKTVAFIKYDKTLTQAPISITGLGIGNWSRLLMPTPSGPTSAKGTGINWPIMRLSDVMLMYAEAENELNNGPTGAAIEMLKTVRKRAFNSAYWTEKVDAYVAGVATGKDAFFNAIVNERAWELGGECIRHYDLIRWNLFGKKIAEAKQKLAQMGENAVNGAGPYDYLPVNLYYRIKADKTIEWFGGIFRKSPVLPPLKDSPSKGDNPDGYTRTPWMSALYNTTTNGPADYILRSWRGYKDESGNAPVPYILPLHSSVVSSSLGSLKNEGYNF